MKYLITLFFCCVACTSFAYEINTEFDNQRMVVDRERVYMISPFRDQDALSCYDFYGNRLWNVRFGTKVLAWDVQRDLIFVFSKERSFGRNTVLHCIDRATGICLWERG